MDKCLFCPINTTKYSSETVSAYIMTLKKEIAFYLKEIGKNINVSCIHFGGGTPSLIKAGELDGVLNTINQFLNIDSSEVLIEMHPKFVNNDLLIYLESLNNCTINFGVQSFNNSVLMPMNRHYKDIDVLFTIQSARKYVNAIGIDYICDWPGSNISTLETDLEFINKIQPNHISQYPLYIKPNSDLEKYLHSCGHHSRYKNKIELNQLCEKCFVKMGYNRYSTYHYEDGKTITHLYGRSQLNGGKWIGFGAEAYTYLGDVARFNSHVREYTKGNFLLKECKLNYTEQSLWEFLFMMRSVSLFKEDIIKKYGHFISAHLDTIIQELKDKNYIYSEHNLGLTWNGIINLNKVEKIVTDLFIKQ